MLSESGLGRSGWLSCIYMSLSDCTSGTECLRLGYTAPTDNDINVIGDLRYTFRHALRWLVDDARLARRGSRLPPSCHLPLLRTCVPVAIRKIFFGLWFNMLEAANWLCAGIVLPKGGLSTTPRHLRFSALRRNNNIDLSYKGMLTHQGAWSGQLRTWPSNDS